MMNLKLNKEYIISTLQNTIVDTVAKVIGIINYDEAKGTGYGIETLALNEKVLSSDSQEYLSSLQYYKCKTVDGKIFLVWPQIIDHNRTNVVNSIENYFCKLNIPISLSTPLSEVLDDMKTYLESKYGVSLTMNKVIADDSDALTLLNEKVKMYESILNSLEAVSSITPTLDRLVDDDIGNTIDGIRNNISELEDKINTLLTGINL